MRPTFVPVAGAALCLALVAGCSGDEQRPSTLPPVSPSPVESAVPSPTPSQTEEQAVEAAVRFYYDGFARAFEKRDAQELARGSAPDCPCRGAVPLVEDLVAKGAVRGGEITVKDLKVIEVRPGLATVNVTLDSRGGEILDASGQVLETFEGEGVVRKAVFLKQVDEGWLPFRIEVLRG